MPSKAADEEPKSIEGYALIDTGATSTCLDVQSASEAGLPIVGSGKMLTATEEVTVPILAGVLSFPFPDFPSVNITRAYGVNLKSQGLIALIRRDLLMRSILIMNGPDGSFSLSI